MSIPLSAATILKQHVTLEVESIDRLYLNAYVPGLQSEGAVADFFRRHRGMPFASSALMAPMTHAFVAAIDRFVATHHLPVITFEKGLRKDEIAARHLAQFSGREGLLFVGKAQEKTRVFRTQRRHNPQTGTPYPWLYRSTAMVNQYYFYLVDEEFGPMFIKFSSYFPYTGRVCVNGHEYVKRQLAREGIVFEALDNGILSCAKPARLHAICDGLTPAKIERMVRKWFRRLPHPFPVQDRAAGYRYDLSILQAEFSLTQVFDRPLMGRLFFEEVLRENLDMGRPDRVQLIFQHRVTKRTPGQFRTRVITDGVIPSLHVEYKHTGIKQYLKTDARATPRALRTETTINDTYDFAIGRRLSHLPALRAVGLSANRRLLDVQRMSHDGTIGEDAFAALTRPTRVAGQRVPALRFGDPRAMVLLGALVVFRFLSTGFSNRMLREHLAPLLGVAPAMIPAGRMTYDLRRLRLHGLIARIAHSNRYTITPEGLRTAIFLLSVHARILRPGLAMLSPRAPANCTTPLRRAFDHLDEVMDQWCLQARIAA